MGTIKNYTFNYTGSVQKFIAPYDGYYLFETWGARGQSILDGNGGYAKGSMRLKKDTELYIYVGGAGWNGGGGGQAIGGGASDIRTVGGVWNDLTSLNSRIIVAGGGGAGERTTGGVGGGGSIPMAGGDGGGSSYTGNLNDAGTTAGINSGDGKVAITFYSKNVFVFFREGLFYIPQKDIITNLKA